MDLRRWHWSSPWATRSHTFNFYALLLLGLLCTQQAKASETPYVQESKHDAADNNKLDSLNNYLPYELREDSEYKRASAFFPLRGKKPSEGESLRSHQLPNSDQGEDKRTQFFPLRGKKVPDDLKRASYFMPMRGRKDDGWTEEEYDVTDENPNKRASSFMPMRGKKKYRSISEYLSKTGTYVNDVSPSDNENQNLDKRLHSFVPVRGKRSLKEAKSQVDDSRSSNNASEYHSLKKRSFSFMPMRGRRENTEPNWRSKGSIATKLVEKKIQSFMPMRGKKDNEEINEKASSALSPVKSSKDVEKQYSVKDFDESKRAQSFMPMRGRRGDYEDLPLNLPEAESELIESKRASYFMPMRGKRSVSEGINNKNHRAKKALSFMPMRGKRSVSEKENTKFASDLDPEKTIAFVAKTNGNSIDEFAVNPWRKDQLYSLLSEKSPELNTMKDKKYFDDDSTVAPWQPDQLMSLFNKKSVAMPMRDKKYFDEDSTVEPWQPDQLMSLLNKKSSFMPMRGRRYFDEAATVAPWQPDQLMSLLNKKSSFMPMRGRRYFDEDSTVAPWQADQLMSLFNKKSENLLDESRYNKSDALNRPQNTVDRNDKNEDNKISSFMPIRGRRMDEEAYFYNPYTYLMAGMGSSLMTKPYSRKVISAKKAEIRKKKLRINWDAVKRAFHATRGKRFQEINESVDSVRDSFTNGSQETKDTSLNQSGRQSRSKRSVIQPRVSVLPIRNYIALKRPMSFFATRGKRMDESGIGSLSERR